MADRLGSLLLDQQVGLRDDADDGTVSVEHGYAADPLIDEQPGHILEGRLGMDGNDLPRHDITNLQHQDHLAFRGKDADAPAAPTGSKVTS